MRQPASLSNALPRHDHHEYGPATSGCSTRTTSTPTGSQQVGEPLPFCGQESRLLYVAAPVLDVVLGVRDVPIATDHRVTIGQRGHPVRECGHEALLLELAVGASLAGLDVDARDSQPV